MQIYEIEGRPIPWMRAGRKGGRYYDKQTKEKNSAQLKVKSCGNRFFSHSDPLKVTMEFHMPIPSSWTKRKKKGISHKPHSSRPDIDNLLKFVNDTLNKILWEDDALIYEIHARKFYSEEPKTRIYVEPYVDEPLKNLLPPSAIKV